MRSIQIITFSQILINIFHKLLQRPAHHILVPCSLCQLLSFFLAFALPVPAVLHFDAQAGIVFLWDQQDQVGNTSNHALPFEDGSGDNIPPRTVRNGEQQLRQPRILQPEPSNTGLLELRFLIPHPAPPPQTLSPISNTLGKEQTSSPIPPIFPPVFCVVSHGRRSPADADDMP